jgi:thymidylate kinase
MGRSRAEHAKSQLLTQKEDNRRGLSFLYHFLIVVDDLLTYVHLRLNRGVVIHDRWPYDMHLQFRSRNYDNRLIAWMFSHFPRPNKLILLRVSARTAYERKRTDPGHVNDGPEYFEALAGWMAEIESRFRYDAVVNAELPLEQVVDEIHKSIRLNYVN